MSKIIIEIEGNQLNEFPLSWILWDMSEELTENFWLIVPEELETENYTATILQTK